MNFKQKENQKRQIIFSLSNKDPFQQSLPSPFWLFDSNFREQKLRQRFGLWWKLELFVVVLGQLLKILIPTFTLLGCWIKDGERKKQKLLCRRFFFTMGYCNFKNPSIRSNPSLFCDVLFWFWILSFLYLGNFARQNMFQFIGFFSPLLCPFKSGLIVGTTQSVLQLLHSSTLGVSYSLCNYLIQQRPV